MGRESAVAGTSGPVRGAKAAPVSSRRSSGLASGQEAILLSGLVAWGICAFALVIIFLPHPWSRLTPDPDSLMRLVQVRDLIAGQAWFDPVQHRLDPPAGLPMHWSRLVDAPLAALIGTGTRLFGAPAGETIALFAWPLLLLGGFIFAAQSAATAVAGRAAAFPAAILAILCIDALTYFIPGRIDHHNVQLILALAALACAARLAAGPVYGIGAGLALALMLAIGMESLPYVLLTAGGVVLFWILCPAVGRSLSALGLTFAAALAVLYAATVRMAGPATCDALSPAYVLPGMVGGFGLALLVGGARRSSRRFRMAGVAGLAAVAIVPTALLFPQCLSGPYGAVSDDLRWLWLDGVAEAQTLMRYASVKPADALGKVGAPVLALIAGGWMLRRHAPVGAGATPATWLFMAATALALALSFAQVRAAPFANTFAISVLAAWICRVRARALDGSGTLAGSAALLAGWLAATPLAWYGIGHGTASLVNATFSETSRSAAMLPGATADAADPLVVRECADRSAAVDLALVAPGRVLSTVFYGPNILAMSGHSVVAGPYHRGEQAILDTVRAMNGTTAEARAIVDRRGIDYVVICATSAETRDTIPEAPDGLLARLVRGEPVAWLTPVAGNSSLMIFRVML